MIRPEFSAGLAAMVANAVSLAATATLLTAVELQVRAIEEPYLATVYGDVYTAYRARVGRFVPGLGMNATTARPAARHAP